jgi:large subunit ribosomal protein L4
VENDMNVKVIDLNGESQEDINLSDDIFNITPNEGVINEAIKNERANKRLGTSCTKDRSMVSGSTKKPWRQKGTGRARSGSRKSPIWRGGGTVFGPKPKDYSYKLPKKIKLLSIRSILSKRNQEDRVRVIEDMSLDNGKTKELVEKLYNMSMVKAEVGDLKNNKKRKIIRNYRLTIITEDEKKLLKQGSRNLPWVKCLSYNKLNAYDLFYSKEIMIEKSVLPKLEDFFLKSK